MGADVDTSVEHAKQALEQYQTLYIAHYAQLMRAKLGLETQQENDQALLQDLLN